MAANVLKRKEHDGEARTKRIKFDGWNIVTLVILVFFILFFIYPLFTILAKSVFNFKTGEFDVSGWKTFFVNDTGYYTNCIWRSLAVSSLATVIATFLGTVLAYILRTVKIRLKNILNMLLMITMVSPPFLASYAWVLLLGRAGIITNFINTYLGFNYQGIYGFAGIVWVFSLKLVPLVNLYVGGALKQVDKTLLEASESLGGHGIGKFFKVVFPLILPTILASAILVFMRVIADFGTPQLIGEGYRTLPTLIYDLFLSDVITDDGTSATSCIIVVVITLILFLTQKYFANRKKIEMSSLRPIDPVKARPVKSVLCHIFCYALVLLNLIPMIIVVLQSFKNSVNIIFGGEWTLQTYADIFTSRTLLRSLKNTFIFSFISLALVIVIGILVAYTSVRRKSVVTSILDTITNIPYIIPGSVLGISLLKAFNAQSIMGKYLHFILVGSAVIMVINFIVRRLPYTIRSSAAILRQIDLGVEEASLSLGANKAKTFIGITVPMMIPGVLSGAVMSWLTIITELSGSVMLYTWKTKTLSVEIYNNVSTGYYGQGAALSTMLMVISTVVLLVFFRVTGKKEIDI